MNIFFDSEFTDFVERQLISIGFVTDDDQKFYGERNDFDLASCSEFVKEVVLPKIGKDPNCIYSKDELAKAIRLWLDQFEFQDPILCFDYDGDWELLSDLLDNDIPHWIKTKNVYQSIDQLLFEHFISLLFNGAQHHALNDAICNKLAYRPD